VDNNDDDYEPSNDDDNQPDKNDPPGFALDNGTEASQDPDPEEADESIGGHESAGGSVNNTDVSTHHFTMIRLSTFRMRGMHIVRFPKVLQWVLQFYPVAFARPLDPCCEEYQCWLDILSCS
jgi:hypothetical protein